MIRPRDLHLNRGKEGGLIIEDKGWHIYIFSPTRTTR
jgi:hypothetical protein